MGGRLTDTDLAQLLGAFRASDADPHQDYGDVGHLIEEIEEHLVLEELIAARKVVDAARSRSNHFQLGSAIVEYDRLFARPASGDG
jgi:hypothetical protein